MHSGIWVLLHLLLTFSIYDSLVYHNVIWRSILKIQLNCYWVWFRHTDRTGLERREVKKPSHILSAFVILIRAPLLLSLSSHFIRADVLDRKKIATCIRVQQYKAVFKEP